MHILVQTAARFAQWRSRLLDVQALLVVTPADPTWLARGPQKAVELDPSTWRRFPHASVSTAAGRFELWISNKNSQDANEVLRLLETAGRDLIGLHRVGRRFSEPQESLKGVLWAYWLLHVATSANRHGPVRFVDLPGSFIGPSISLDGLHRSKDRKIQEYAAQIGERPAWWIEWPDLLDSCEQFSRHTSESILPTFASDHPELVKQAMKLRGKGRVLLDLLIAHGGEVDMPLVAEKLDYREGFDQALRKVRERANRKLVGWRIEPSSDSSLKQRLVEVAQPKRRRVKKASGSNPDNRKRSRP